MLRKSALLSLLICAAFCSRAFATDPDHFEFWRQAHVSLDAAGKVTAIQFLDKPDPVTKQLEPVIRTWLFEPAKIGDKPVPTETTLQLHLQGLKTSDDSYAIKVLSANTGAGLVKPETPDYPSGANQDYAEASFNLLIQTDATGAPIQVDVEKVESNGSRHDRASMIDAAIKAAKRWRFQPESVDGIQLAAKARVPVMFCMAMRSTQCPKWEQERAEKGDATQPNTPIALDSQVKLITQVVGTTL